MTPRRRTSSADHFLEVGVLAQLHIYGIDEHVLREPRGNIGVWEMQRDACALAMLLTAPGDQHPRGVDVVAAVDRITEAAQLALIEADGRYLAAILAQEASVATSTYVLIPD